MNFKFHHFWGYFYKLRMNFNFLRLFLILTAIRSSAIAFVASINHCNKFAFKQFNLPFKHNKQLNFFTCGLTSSLTRLTWVELRNGYFGSFWRWSIRVISQDSLKKKNTEITCQENYFAISCKKKVCFTRTCKILREMLHDTASAHKMLK